MHIQLNRILVFIALFSFIFVSCASEANSVGNGLQDIKDYFSSLSLKEIMENMSPSTIIGLCIATVVFVVVFRGLIFFMIMFGVLIMMFGSTEKATDYLKEKFNFAKDMPLPPGSKKEDKN